MLNFSGIPLIFSAFALSTAALGVYQENYNVTFGDSPQRFSLRVDPTFVSELKARVGKSKYIVDDLSVPAYVEGPTRANATVVGKYWAESYDWSVAEAEINQQFQQFTTTIHLENTTYTDPVPLHFVHHRSPRADAVPLLFLHGWPESFLSIGPLINQLTDPSESGMPAFHVVAPSIPGFALSPAPTSTGFGVYETAEVFNKLMQQLGYDRYVMQAGDLGAVILRYQASMFPQNVVSVLPNLWLEAPTSDDLSRQVNNQTTEQENAYLAELKFFATNAAHFYTQSIAPLQAAHALMDSPVGLAMWIYHHMGLFSPNYVWSLDEIITWTMMFLIQDAGPVGAMRTYKEYTKQGAFIDGVAFGEPPYVAVPVGLTKRIHDVGFNLPDDWALRGGNITSFVVHQDGGHFAAYQDPTLLDDIRDFFGNTSISATGEFHSLVY